MGVYGDVAVRAWNLATLGKRSPPDAWRAAVEERYSDPAQRRNALKHTCPKGAFLGLCGRGLVRDVEAGEYTASVRSTGFALAAVELLRADPALAGDKSRLQARVFRGRRPNDEVDVVLTLWSRGLLR